MAFYNQLSDEEEEQQAQGAPQTSAPAADINSGASSQPAAVTSQSAAPSAPVHKQEPFFGISQYINANKPQSEKLANQVAGGVNQKAGAVDDALNNANNSFNQAAEAQKVTADPNLFNQVSSNAEQVASDADKRKQFESMRDASYKGPTKLEDLDEGKTWGGIQTLLDNAKKAKASTATEEGRMGLIKDLGNGHRQTQGGLTFDNLLLQSDPNSAAKLQGAGASLNDIDQRLAGAQTAAGAKAKEISDIDESVKNQARGALTSGYGGLKSSLTDREAAKDLEQKEMVNKLKFDLASKGLDPKLASQFGIDPTQAVYGLRPANFLQYQDGADRQSVATQEDLARQLALKSLAGDVDLGDDLLSSSAPIGEIRDPVGFDKSGYESAVAQRAADYDKDVRALMIQKGVNPKSDINAFLKNYKFTDAEKAVLNKYKGSANQSAGDSFTDRSTRGV